MACENYYFSRPITHARIFFSKKMPIPEIPKFCFLEVALKNLENYFRTTRAFVLHELWRFPAIFTILKSVVTF